MTSRHSSTRMPTWQRLTESRRQRLDEAITCYCLRRDRQQNPTGSFDNKGRWYPDTDTEREKPIFAESTLQKHRAHSEFIQY